MPIFNFTQGNYRARRKFFFIRNIGNTDLILDYVHITNTNKFLQDSSIQPLPTNSFNHFLYPWQIFYEDYALTSDGIYTHVDSVSGQTGIQLEFSTETSNHPFIDTYNFEKKPSHPYSEYRNPFSYNTQDSSGIIEYASGIDITGSTHPSGLNLISNEFYYQPKLFQKPFLDNYRLGRKVMLNPYFNIDGSVVDPLDNQMIIGLQCRIKNGRPGVYSGQLIINYHFIDSFDIRQNKEIVINLQMTLSRSNIEEMDLVPEPDIFSIEGALLDNAEVVEIF
tara:strand:- start:2241 stop:3077 length:837 start_codon:yes stop_codon:yes gene_type:complete